MDQLNSHDSYFISSESRRTPFHIAHMRIYDPSTSPNDVVRFKDILHCFEKNLHNSAIFRKQLVRTPLDLDNPYWIESPDFNIEYHVRHLALPKPGDWRQLCILLARLHSQPLNMSLPLWEAYVIEGLDNVKGMPEGAFAVMIKMHHAIADGRTADAMLEAIHDKSSEPSDNKIDDFWRPEPVPTDTELAINTLANFTKMPFGMLKNVQRMVKKKNREEEFLKDHPDFKNEFEEPCIFNGAVSSAKVFGAGIFDIADLKTIKNSVPGATINDAVLLITSYSVTEYLTHHGKMVSAPLRSGFTMDTKAISEYKDGANFATGIFMEVHNEIDNPVERLAAIKEETSLGKEYATRVAPDGMRDFSQMAPAPIMNWGLKLATRYKLMSSGAQQHYLITNVPGPRSPRFLAGAKALCSFGLSPVGDGTALVHMTSSYCDKISVSFQSCREIMPDPDFYAKCLQNAFEKVLKAAQAASPAQQKAS